jgi:hypothetical protein
MPAKLSPASMNRKPRRPFDLTLTTEKGVTVLGNTPVKEQQEDGGELVTRFETSPRMSTYLLAFVIGNMHAKTTKTNRGTDVSIWATVAQPAESLDFALDVAKRSSNSSKDYFGVPYPLPKADHIALPDFSSGAMENWGLITYRERVLLAYPGETSQSTREQIATVVAHETSHQWFGNLVTMKWWDDLWLNESFANMMEYEAVDAMFPIGISGILSSPLKGLSALRRDATPGVQPVKVAVNHPEEISTLFDPSIVYAKGGRLLNMLKNYIGEEAFRSGLSEYFTPMPIKILRAQTSGNRCPDPAARTSVPSWIPGCSVQASRSSLSTRTAGASSTRSSISQTIRMPSTRTVCGRRRCSAFRSMYRICSTAILSSRIFRATPSSCSTKAPGAFHHQVRL